MLKAIHAQEDRKAAEGKMQSVIADLRLMKLGKAAELLEEYGQETLTYYGFPDSHWIKLRTNNPLERIMREIRRRTRVVGAFPDGKSCLKLTKTKGAFPNENSLLKLLYAGILNASKKWTMPIHNWNMTVSQLAIHFEGRMDGVLKI